MYDLLADNYYDRGQLEEAKALLLKVQTLYHKGIHDKLTCRHKVRESELPHDDSYRMSAEVLLATIYYEQGDPDEVVALLRNV